MNEIFIIESVVEINGNLKFKFAIIRSRARTFSISTAC
jgi:hypothetical protein